MRLAIPLSGIFWKEKHKAGTRKKLGPNSIPTRSPPDPHSALTRSPLDTHSAPTRSTFDAHSILTRSPLNSRWIPARFPLDSRSIPTRSPLDPFCAWITTIGRLPFLRFVPGFSRPLTCAWEPTAGSIHYDATDVGSYPPLAPPFALGPGASRW